MTKRPNFESKYLTIRSVLSEAKSLLEEDKISIIQYRSIIRELLKEVKELDEDYVNENIGELFNSLINGDQE